MRCLFLLLAASLLGACGIKGSLEKPAGSPPPSLYERAFGKDAPVTVVDAPEQDDASLPENLAE
ncbi:MAG: lipoprotein [Zoogloeaceae bacterium]|nr:lipoprotein [Zoogloeaceae bacterium]